jgi:hypothetical protein
VHAQVVESKRKTRKSSKVRSRHFFTKSIPEDSFEVLMEFSTESGSGEKSVFLNLPHSRCY